MCVAAAAWFLCVPGCGRQPDQAPVIASVDGPRAVSARDSAGYTCQASDPEGQSLQYSWSCSRGEIARESANTMVWRTPSASDTARIFVTVRDDSGSVTDSARVRVMKDTAVFIQWWDGAVKAGEFTSWRDSVVAGDTIHGWTGTVADTFGNVYVMVLDESNFQRWVQHQTPQILLRRVAYRADTFSLGIGTTDRYRIVLDNTENETDYDYWMYVVKVSP